MSLQVWLPFNGDLHNQGLSNITMTNNGAAIDNNGKIGKCYYFNGSSYLQTSSLPGIQSVCFWIKMEKTSTVQVVFADYKSKLSFGFNASNQVIVSCVDKNIKMYTDTNFPNNIWTHIALVYNFDNSDVLLYINGVLQTTRFQTNNYFVHKTDNLIIGARNNNSIASYINGYINDFRMYDHRLSTKEVEEISKGLVLHYKLDDVYSEATTMLSCNITETAYNSPISKYGYNDESNLIKTIGNFQGKECVKIGTRTAGQQARPYAYFGNLFTSDGTNAPAYKALSFDYYTTVPTTTWLNIYKLGSGEGTATWKTTNSDGIYSGTYTNSSNAITVKPNEWNHIEVVFHGTTSANAEWGYCINGPTHTSNADYYFLYANIQLEQNDHVTGYGSNFHSSIIYDSSGYQNNGIISGNLITSNTDIIKYFNTTNFNGSSYILTPSGSFNWYDFSQGTFCTWMKPTATASGWSGSVGIAGDNNQNSKAFGLSYYANSFRPVYNNTSYTTITTGKSMAVNQWHFCCATLNGTTVKSYFDGVLVNTTTIDWKTATISTNLRFQVGVDLPGTDEKFTGNYSDVRFYTTVLTDKQIKELYDTSVSIDNQGNIYARELVE